MKAFQPYLNFDGETRDAMTFYHKALGGDLHVMTFAESGQAAPPGSENRVMHARLANGNAILMASDTMPGHPFVKGTYVHVNGDCDSTEGLGRGV
jgi:PhnB protein